MSNGASISPSNQSFNIGGFPILGRAPGTYFTFTYDVDQKVVIGPGVDGNSYFIETDNYAATMVVFLLPNSIENFILTGLFNAARAAPNGLIVPIIATAPQGTFSGLGRVAGIPPMEFADAAITIPWTIVSGNMQGGYTGILPSPLP